MDRLRPDDPTVVGAYRLVMRLGSGGMGEVFLGRSPSGRPVAVKMLRPDLASTPRFRERFALEVEAAKRVGGFHTAQVVEAAPDAWPPWLVTAYIPGPTLHEAVREHGPLPADSVLTLGAGLAEGLAAIHACGLVHRDLKPSNVILAADGPRVIDFGIAKALDRTAVTAVGAVIGTPAFMSPEQARGDEVGPATDVFSLGAVLAFAACGQSRFTADSVDAMLRRPSSGGSGAPALPEGLRGLIAGCLVEDPAERPQVDRILASLTAMTSGTLWTDDWLPPAVSQMIRSRVAELGRAIDPGATDHDPPASGPGAPEEVSRRRFLVAGGVLAAGAALAGGGTVVHRIATRPTPVFGGGWRELFTAAGARRVFREAGLDVEVNDISGIEMTRSPGRYQFFLCPDDNIAATVEDNFRRAGHSPPKPRQIFDDRMVVLVHRALLECLAGQSIVRAERGYQIFDVGEYLERRLKEEDWTWGRIGGPERFTQKESQVELVSAAPCTAGGGDLYLSLLIHVRAKGRAPDEDRLVEDLEPLFRNSWPASTIGLLQEFFSGHHQYPMIFVYEHDALRYLAGRGQAADYRLLYTDPGVISKHMFVSRDSEGGAVLVGDLLQTTPLRRVMAGTFFLRGTGDEGLFEDAVAEHGLAGCIRQEGAAGPPGPPIPSDTAPFLRPDLMVKLRKEIVRCSG